MGAAYQIGRRHRPARLTDGTDLLPLLQPYRAAFLVHEIEGFARGRKTEVFLATRFGLGQQNARHMPAFIENSLRQKLQLHYTKASILAGCCRLSMVI